MGQRLRLGGSWGPLNFLSGFLKLLNGVCWWKIFSWISKMGGGGGVGGGCPGMKK